MSQAVIDHTPQKEKEKERIVIDAQETEVGDTWPLSSQRFTI